MADEGFSAMFDNGLPGKPPELQEKIAKEMDRLGMTIGPFVMYAEFSKPTFVTQDKEFQDQIVNTMKEAVEVSKRTDAKWALIAPGCISQRMEVDYQTANLIDNVRRCVEIAEPAGVVIVLEPLNWWANHPGLFLQGIPQTLHGLPGGQQPVVQDRQRPVPPADHRGQPDPEHRQGLERNRRVPPRRQPRPQRARHGRDQLQEHLPAHLHKKGYQGVLCMEHGKSKRGKEGERAVIDAYRACDNFEV